MRTTLVLILMIGALFAGQVHAQDKKTEETKSRPTQQIQQTAQELDGKVKTQVTLLAADPEAEALKGKHKAPVRSDFKSEADYLAAKKNWVRKHREVYDSVLKRSAAKPD